ncbi:hypothetical protein V8F20_003309 [Naviculisporaceae sp. PSN 640]
MGRYPDVEPDDVREPFKQSHTPEVIEATEISQSQPFLPNSVIRRWLFSLASVIPVCLVLWGFQQFDDLGTWNRRAFNTLSLCAIALMSLFLGSVTQLLGTMIRWPLLASRPWPPRDVDRILGLADPTTSIKLIWNDVWTRRQYSKATATASVYLFATVGASLGVAVLGLTYDLNDVDGVVYPAMLTDWGTPAWLNGDRLDHTWRRFADFASIGLASVPTTLIMSDPTTYTRNNISGQGLDRKVDEDGNVTYSYSLKEYVGLDVISSKENIVHSSSRCLGRNMFNGNVYEKGKLVGKFETTKDDSPDWLAMLNTIYGFVGAGLDFFWAAGTTGELMHTLPGCATTYIHTEAYNSHNGTVESRNVTLYECITCLTDSTGAPGFGSSASGSALFRNLPPSKSLWAANVLLYTGTYERIYAYSYRPELGLFMRQYSSQQTTLHFLTNLGSWASDKENKDWNEDWYSKPVPMMYEVEAAHLTAQLPILSIIGAETQLPRVTKEEGASEQPFTQTRLQVKWHYVAISLVCIQVILMSLVFAVCWICKKSGVPLPDHDSYLAVAWLFKRAMGQGGVEMNSAGTGNGERLAAALERDGGLRYKTASDGGEEWGLHYEAEGGYR